MGIYGGVEDFTTTMESRMENLNGHRHGNWDDMGIYGTPVFIYNTGKYRGMAQTETAVF